MSTDVSHIQLGSGREDRSQFPGELEVSLWDYIGVIEPEKVRE